MNDAAIFGDEPHEESSGGALPAPADEARGRTLVLLPASAPHDEAPRWAEAPFAEPPAPRARFSGRWRAAASLAAVVLIGAAAAAQMHVVSAERGQTGALDRRLDAIAAQLHALDANRPHDDLAGVKKSLADIKASSASAHELGGAVGQLTARVDRLEKDQSNHLDKLDKDSTQRLVDIAQRLEKLEARPPAVAVAKTDVPAQHLAEIAQRVEKLEARAPAAVVAKTEVAKTAAPVVSMETTGAIDKPKPRLRNFYLADIRNGYAMIGGPEGEFAVAPGDNVPGGGRVLRIERHGRDWVVVTTLGQIVAQND